MSDMPAVSGIQLMDLLAKDGWEKGRKATHGICFTKTIPDDRTLVTFIPDTSFSLPKGTLEAILGMKQTCITKKGLKDLIKKYGLK
jgi:hypothetical protein